MAIAFARARYLSRSTGGCAVRSACYNAREALTDERTGERYSFAHRVAPEHHAVLLPEGADARLGASAVLWNLAEAAERRGDAQVAREIVLALPADRELTPDDRVALAESFARTHFVARGLAVQLDVHAPHGGDGPGEGGEAEGERANHHAHLLITTRRVEGDRLAARKARDLDPVVRSLGGRAAVTDGARWGELWRAHQDAYFARHGLELRVDATAPVPGRHVGPVRMRVPDSAAVARAEEVARANAVLARSPETVLQALTRGHASFTERELDRFLAKHIPDGAEHLAVKAQVLGHGDVLALHDPATGAPVGRYTTREVRAQERAALADGAAVAASRHGGLSATARDTGLEGRTLRADQRAAFDRAVGPGGLVLLEGRAGTGKSHMLGAVRAAHEAAGYEVIGLAPTNAVAQDLAADGFGAGAGSGVGPVAVARPGRAATVHSELFRLKNGRVTWGARTLVVVDEAAMCDARVTGELLAEARRSGAKVLLAGDDRQLASIERGGLFTELKAQHGSAEIIQVTRQKVDWQRQAAQDLAESRTEAAVAAFAREGALHWAGTQEAARAALVARWSADTAADPHATRFVFAYTNREVDALNAELRAVRKARGELGEDMRLETKHGAALFAVGDRVQVTETLRSARLWNGNAGVITGLDARTGRITARLDGQAGREVSWRAGEFTGFRHGYAGTIYKGQGKTIDHTYLLHSAHWRQASSYVALTRQRESARIFAARETAMGLAQLARQMSRPEVRAASVAWATRDELPPDLRPEVGQGAWPSVRSAERAAPEIQPGVPGAGARAAEAAPVRTSAGSDPRPSRAVAGSTSGARPEASSAPRWLIAPHAVAPLGSAERAAAGAAAAAIDPAVRREREALGRYLAGAYRNPEAAAARLTDLVATHGPTSAARRIEADPEQLGSLAGRAGLLAGRAARAARAQAERVAQAVGPAVRRIGDAEAAAAQGALAGLEARRAAAATGVPTLSARAEAAVRALGAAGTPPERAEAWALLQADAAVAGEVASFVRAVEGRLGPEAVRLMERLGPGAAQALAEPGGEGDPEIPRATLATLGDVVQRIGQGERAAVEEGRRLVLASRLRQGPRMKP
ncbi:AAA family ATPase [Rubellimicrobium aerolatum]|uniref:AAA family ATPase n=1 Tax=Rubellimicrobium aerolatum TaxID=490979 RepID=A0ABW0SF53_9RHOB|nr:AAA family ATPase [Rubellimicrobium aerolatum]MBP1806914.1 Ti-type conjugative transfer relaxase TraA [Rubellimicrobium aerolatum]